jgi:hypothetical protein
LFPLETHQNPDTPGIITHSMKAYSGFYKKDHRAPGPIAGSPALAKKKGGQPDVLVTRRGSL